MIYGYARVSTIGQSNDGNSLDAQIADLKASGAITIISEAYTGTKVDRPKFTELIKSLTDGDTLMVTKLDRFARTAGDGIKLIDELLSRGVTINILNMGVINSTPVGKLTRTIFLGFAEFERDMIIQRTAEGKRMAKLNNPDYKEGRKRLTFDQDLFAALVKQVDAGLTTVTSAAKQLGISRATYLRRRAEI